MMCFCSPPASGPYHQKLSNLIFLHSWHHHLLLLRVWPLSFILRRLYSQFSFRLCACQVLKTSSTCPLVCCVLTSARSDIFGTFYQEAGRKRPGKALEHLTLTFALSHPAPPGKRPELGACLRTALLSCFIWWIRPWQPQAPFTGLAGCVGSCTTPNTCRCLHRFTGTSTYWGD